MHILHCYAIIVKYGIKDNYHFIHINLYIYIYITASVD